ncbi:MAG: hypothetical protein ACFE9N_09570 [Promethearchaeota archaeon]
MDTGSDFIRPEFLNIVFFQQKNLVIFPYVDLKHLHGLEIFTAGYNVVNLESTALHNLKEILEFENTNSYSQNPTLYFIYNVDREKIKELMLLEGIRCIINSSENIGNLANGSKFIFFNKKNNQFLNYNIDDIDLEFEHSLIADSEDIDILQESIQKIKIASTRIFKELNQTGTLETLPDILKEYDKKYWKPILDFTSLYYDINIPNISEIKFKHRKTLTDYSDEYDLLISTNRALGKEFIQLLHEYRSKRVNPAHLELDELYNPQKLYNYLRNHHWKEGIPEDFIEEWGQMNISNYQLTGEDQSDFMKIMNKLKIEHNTALLSPSETIQSRNNVQKSNLRPQNENIPSLQKEWDRYRHWLLNRLDNVEKIVHRIKNSDSTVLNKEINFKVKLYLHNEISYIQKLLKEHCIQDEKRLKEEDQKGKTPLNNELLIVDLTNILNLDKDENGALKISNILTVNNTLKSLGYKPLMIVDANMKHFTLDDRPLYDELLQKRMFIQAPAGRKADEFVLEFAKAENCRFLANDMYTDFYDEFGQEWIFEHRLTCMLTNGLLIMR